MAYCSLDDLKNLGYNFTEDDEAALTAICDAASARVDAYCHQSFVYTENFDEKHVVRVKNGTVRVFPRNLVVDKINSINFLPWPETQTPHEITNFDYIPAGAVIVGATMAYDGDYAVNLNYDYGYADGAYPSDLMQATVFMAAPTLDDYFSARDANMSGLKMLQQGKLKIERGTLSASSMLDTAGYPANATSLLNGGGYVRVRGDWL